MSADDEEHSESESYYPTEDITLPSIDRSDVLFGSFIRVPEGRLGEIQRGELKKYIYYFYILRPREIFLYTDFQSGE
jgi:hypothetical protein